MHLDITEPHILIPLLTVLILSMAAFAGVILSL